LNVKGETDLKIRLNEGVSFYSKERINVIGDSDDTLKTISIYWKGDKIELPY
jgi:hypothetical protein